MAEFNLTPETIGKLTKWYKDNEVPKGLRAADKKLLADALKAAGGDYRRLTLEDDGSLIVWNWPVWGRYDSDPAVRPLPRWAR